MGTVENFLGEAEWSEPIGPLASTAFLYPSVKARASFPLTERQLIKRTRRVHVPSDPCREVLMPLFQLPIAVTLASGALLSLAVRCLSASKWGKIALPVTLDDPLEPRRDPFDVTSPEDIIDGEPINESSFWLNVRSLISKLSEHYGSSLGSIMIFLDEAPRNTSGHCFCHRCIPTNHLLGLCRFVFVLNDRSHIPAPCVVCRLSLDSRGSVRGQKLDLFAYQERYPPLRPYNSHVYAVGFYCAFSS